MRISIPICSLGPFSVDFQGEFFFLGGVLMYFWLGFNTLAFWLIFKGEFFPGGVRIYFWLDFNRLTFWLIFNRNSFSEAVFECISGWFLTDLCSG